MKRREQVIDVIDELREAFYNKEIQVGEDFGYTENTVISALEDAANELEGKHPFD